MSDPMTTIAALEARATSAEAENARLREALEKIASNDTDGLHTYTPQAMQGIAARALSGGGE